MSDGRSGFQFCEAELRPDVFDLAVESEYRVSLPYHALGTRIAPRSLQSKAQDV
jgi:hypothetical protein